MNKTLEICCYTYQSALIAAQAGADRIELCNNYLEGGTTPSYATIKKVLNSVKIPVYILIRPRGGDFLYTKDEFDIIKQDVKIAKQLGADGVVIGFLNENGEIDYTRLEKILKITNGMSVTFHRAFDMCKNPLEEVKQLEKLGVNRILTSGGHKKAIFGVNLLEKLVNETSGKLKIMPGCGVNSENLKELYTKTKAIDFHASAKTFIASKMKFQNKQAAMGDRSLDEFYQISTDASEIKKMKSILNSL